MIAEWDVINSESYNKVLCSILSNENRYSCSYFVGIILLHIQVVGIISTIHAIAAAVILCLNLGRQGAATASALPGQTAIGR